MPKRKVGSDATTRKRGRPRNSTQSPEGRKRQLQKLQTKIRLDGNLEKTLDIDSDPESTPLRRPGIRSSRIKVERGSNSEQEQKYIKIDSDTDSHAASLRSRTNPRHNRPLLLETIVDKHVAVRSQRIQAIGIFERIISYCDDFERKPQNHFKPSRQYKRNMILKLSFDYGVNEVARDSVLEYFLRSLASPDDDPRSVREYSDVITELSLFDDKSPTEKMRILKRLQVLSDHLIDDFFLPLRAASAQTPKPRSRLSHKHQGKDILEQVTQRLFSLREQCFRRDRHRCRISRVFDEAEADKRKESVGDRAKDDDGSPLGNQGTSYLEVTHIIPHSFVSPEGSSTDAQRTALRILNLFDPGIVDSLEGPSIDGVHNAVTLTHNYRRRFGNLKVYFEAVPKAKNRYIVKLAESRDMQPEQPILVDFSDALHNNIEPPMPRLLAIHRACSRILKNSDVGAYLDTVIGDL